MIYVFDNGESYNDHGYEFITTEGYDEEEAEKFLRLFRPFKEGDLSHDDDDYYFDSGFLVFRAVEVEWFKGGARKLHHIVHWRRDDVIKKIKEAGISNEFVQTLIAGWASRFDETRAFLKKRYASHPQKKRAAKMLENALEGVDAEERGFKEKFEME